MSKLKINENQYVGKQELNRLLRFLTTDGYKLLFKSGISRYGFVRLLDDINFDNLRAVEGSGPDKVTIKAGYAIDKNADVITVDPDSVDALTIPTDSTERLIVVSYAERDKEVGTVTISVDGTLTGVGTKFLDVLRGTPNHPVKIKFRDSSLNTQEYQVASVLSNTSAVILGASFTAESGQSYSVVGTFTPGIPVPNSSKYIYNYSDATFRLQDTSYIPVDGLEFIIAGVISDGVSLTIFDRRFDSIFNMGEIGGYSQLTQVNPMVGLESLKYDSKTSSKEYNIARVGWGLRPTVWTADVPNNRLVITAASGGIHVDLTTVSTGDFDGWRLYFSNGRYQNIIISVVSLGVLTVTIEDYNETIHPTSGPVTIVHQADFIQLLAGSASYPNQNVEQVFPIFRGYADIRVKAPANTQIGYRSMLGKNTSLILPINAGKYLEPTSFDGDGNQILTSYLLVAGGTFVNPSDPVNTHEDFMAWKNRNNIFVSGLQNTYNGTELSTFLSKFTGSIELPLYNELAFSTPPSGTYDGYENRNHIQFVTSGNAEISAFGFPNNGKIIIVRNSYSSAGTLTIRNNSGSHPNGKIIMLGGVDLTLKIGEAAAFAYNINSQRWEFLFGSSSLDSNWNDLTLLNSYAELNPDSKPQYRRNKDGLVQFRGVLDARSVTGTHPVAFTLPVELRPNLLGGTRVNGVLVSYASGTAIMDHRYATVSLLGSFAIYFPSGSPTAADIFDLSSFTNYHTYTS